MPEPASTNRRMGLEMFALSFTALFLEMMVIRWVPSVVHLVAYYANLMLLSSFLGLGAGAMASGRKWNLFGWFPLILACDIGLLLVSRNAATGITSSEVRFFAVSQSSTRIFILVGIFAMNALLFVPLGQRMGLIFDSLPRLTAYFWDLAGSLCGTLCFGIFSLKMFSPVLGIAGVMVLYLAMSKLRRWLFEIPVLAGILAVVIWNNDPNAIWSPYYHVTIVKNVTPGVTESAPPPDLLTMRDPPIYSVQVNQFGYHLDASMDLSRYTPGSAAANGVLWLQFQYGVPYAIADGRDKVLVVGAGGGCDVEAALAVGVKHVDAVEVDPAVVRISRRFNAAAPYSDPRVSVHIDDARSFLAKASPGYDLVVFGFLDSQALFSSMNNVRLDGYVYTVEGIRSAYRLLGPNGMLSLSFGLGKPWMGPKLYEMVVEATGREPFMYYDADGPQLILCVPKNTDVVLPQKVFRFTRISYGHPPKLDLATDDWPFLYLTRKSIPSDYLAAIACLMAVSIAAVTWLRKGALGKTDVHFGLLGMGFMLLETKSITDCSLFFGATWLVSMIVITGVLIMVIAANLVAERLKGFSFWMYVPLFGVLALLLGIPREYVVAFDFTGRLLWTLFVVPLPIFFAGIIFSTTFRSIPLPSAAFGANLIGAMLGGFCEYLSMAIGSYHLSLLVFIAYLGSLLVLIASRRSPQIL